MTRLVFLFLFSAFFELLLGQGLPDTKIFTGDIDNFWIAYDSVLKVRDTTIQKQIIQTLYLDKATRGLKDFIILGEHSAGRHLNNILQFPKFWVSIRTRTLQIENYKTEIEDIIERFNKLYPELEQPEIYFTIGCLNPGGMTETGRVLIGSEIAASDSTVDASELGTWLQSVFKDQKDIVCLVTHEIVHAQQKGYNISANLLSNSLAEGSADFIAEILMQKPIVSPYITYGLANEKQLWQKFQKEMYRKDLKDWLYNGSQAKNADLGYFMGYAICKSYYAHSKNKQKAITKILNLEYGNDRDVKQFFLKSGYADKWK